MKVTMTEAICQEGLALLEGKADIFVAHDAHPHNYLDQLKDTDAFIVRVADKGAIDKETMESSDSLKVIGRTGIGYDSVDGYQRAFRNAFGCNPYEYAKSPIPLPLFTPYGVKFKTLWKEQKSMEHIANVFIQVVEKPERKVIIKRGKTAKEYWSYCQEVGCDVWGILTSMKSLCGEPVCLWLPEKYRKPNTSVYVQGVEVTADYTGIIPDGFDVITLPAAKYLMFQGEPFKEEDYCQAIEAVQLAMERYDPSTIGYVWDETNPRIQLEPRGERGYIELRAVQ